MMDRSQSVVLFLVDGMRPDGLQAAETPTIDGLVLAGASTFNARTVMPSATLPCHMSLFHSVPPERHGITSNTYTPQVRPVPGLMDVVQQSGGIAVAFYNWEELRDVARPGALQASFFVRIDEPAKGRSDDEVATLAARWLADNPFHLAFVYLGCTDVAGHAYGWMSAEYLQAIAHADRCIGRVMASFPGDPTVIVASDHGGHEYTHGTDMEADMTIPLVIKGPGWRAGVTIDRPVSIIDIAPTILSHFDIEAPGAWRGVAIGSS